MTKKKANKSNKKPGNRRENNDDLWDDRLLIKAYEQAIKLKKSDVAKSIATDTNKKPSTSKSQLPDENTENETCNGNTTFKLGDYVRATYDADNIDYEAQIIGIDDVSGECVVKFIGYNNEQSVYLSDLVDSWGKAEQQKQKSEAAAIASASAPSDLTTEQSNDDSDDFNATKFYRNDLQSSSLPVPPMPPLPPMLKDSLGAESEHFSAMLMSWYMSGYYTGLYQGHKLAQQKRKRTQN